MKTQFFTLIFLSLQLLLNAELKPTVSPPLYAFQNGVQSLPPEQAALLLQELGYQGIGSVYPSNLASFKAAFAPSKLKIFSIYTGGKVNSDSYQIDHGVIEAIKLLKGTDTLIELNVQKGNQPNDAQAIAMVCEIADQAKSAGLKVVIYPHDNFHIERLDHALRIAKATGRNNVGVAFNLCHFLKVQSKDDLAAALLAAKPYLWSASICGADTNGTDWITLIQPLDQGSFDQASLMRQLQAIDFNGPIGLQCFNLKSQPHLHLASSIAAWKKNLSHAK